MLKETTIMANSLRLLLAFSFSALLLSSTGMAQKRIDKVEEDEISVKKYLDKKNLDEIEGIYKNYSGQYYKLGIKKYEDYYIAIVLDSYDKSKWKPGTVKAYFDPSAREGTYAMTWLMGDRAKKETIAEMEDGAQLKFQLPIGEFGERVTVKFLKLYPKE
ncbi:MAG: hypothetical protein ACK420_01400 [Sphingomonadales bacterium]